MTHDGLSDSLKGGAGPAGNIVGRTKEEGVIGGREISRLPHSPTSLREEDGTGLGVPSCGQ